MPLTDAPTREVGSSAGNLANALAPVGRGRSWLAESYEDVPELTFPRSAEVYDRVRKDGQVAAILRAIRLPLLHDGRHRLDTDGVDPRVTRLVELNLGLGDAGRSQSRSNAVSLGETIYHALLSLVFGFMPLEQVYNRPAAPPGELDVGLARIATLRRLAPRMPRSISEVRVDSDGNLIGVVQASPAAPGTPDTPPGYVLIPVDQLVMFCHEREGADWHGSSLLREAYKHWLIKDALLRLGPMVVERNGMGLPVVTYPAQGDRAKALEIATSARAGAEAGVALEEGYTLQLLGVTGATRDELPLLKYHDESIGRSSLAMFLNLGHDNGARALGDTFVDYFCLAEGAIDREINGVITDHVIRDLVELHYGADEPWPRLVADPVDAESTPTAEALGILAEKGLLGVIDDGLVADVRRRYRLPAVAPGAAPAVPEATVPDTYQPAGVDPEEGPPTGLPQPEAAGADPLLERLEAVTAKLAALRAHAPAPS